jgi:threonine/homoserine/homoserine lactone efflux protein
VNLPLFIQGVLIGFSIAAPVGPIGILCIRRTLAHGLVIGFLTGLGAACADAVYGAIAAFGLTSLSTFLLNFQESLRLIGGIFLLYLGMRILISKPVSQSLQPNGTNYLSAFLSTFLLTITNPVTIFAFLGIFVGLGIPSAINSSYHDAVSLVLGVFSGSTLWWAVLSCLSAIVRHRLVPTNLLWVNRVSGIIIISFGIFVLISMIIR